MQSGFTAMFESAFCSMVDHWTRSCETSVRKVCSDVCEKVVFKFVRKLVCNEVCDEVSEEVCEWVFDPFQQCEPLEGSVWDDMNRRIRDDFLDVFDWGSGE